MGDAKKKYSADELLQFAYKHNQIPVILFAKDTDCKYIYTSEVENLIDGGEDNSILGKTDMDIQYDRELGKVYYEQDKEIMRTGNSCHCYFEFIEDGKTVYREIVKTPVYVDDKVLGVCGVVSDVTELMTLKKKFESLTFLDNLTGIYNRNYFLKFDFNKKESLPCAYIMCDCNDLKGVNDKLGHAAGDIYIQETAKILEQYVSDTGICIRWGGDEFLIVTPVCDRTAHEKIIRNIKTESKKFSATEPHIGLAVGGALRLKPDIEEAEILKAADQEMYQNKTSHKQSVSKYRLNEFKEEYIKFWSKIL